MECNNDQNKEWLIQHGNQYNSEEAITGQPLQESKYVYISRKYAITWALCPRGPA